MRAFALLIALMMAAPLAAQETPEAKFVPAPDEVIHGGAAPAPGYIEELIEAERPKWRSEERPVAILRGLDKIAGRVADIRVKVGETATYERLHITVEECRVPPAGEVPDAFVFLKVVDGNEGVEPVFSGWMFASSPALSAMDHQRYDLWVLSCATS
ncbi:DUF2155 domain-containing protein [Pikeienuella sp. HZG-20]|uniref:DUF2155 domain-containing protein n=1 Tax=Paludibacillus litoralis TaxID=3133267 RepID=UPI0030EC1A2B